MAQQKRKTSCLVPVTSPRPVEQLLLDIPSAAKALSSTVWTVRGLLYSKKLPFFKLGRRLVIDIADIRAFIDAQKKEAA